MNFFSRKSVAFLSVAIALITFALVQLTQVKIAENLYEDFLVTTPSTAQVLSDEIIVIEVRDSTLSNFPYISPLDREFLANLIDKLVDSETRAIGIDLIFDQPSETTKDIALKSSLHRARNIVFLPRVHVNKEKAKLQYEFQENFLKGLRETTVVLAKDRNDGVVRHYLADDFTNGDRLQQLSAAMAGVQMFEKAGKYRRIFYQSETTGNPHKFKTYPAEAAMVLPAEWFRGKYVLIGKNIANIDQFRTPYSSISGEALGVLPGVQIHAHILNQLLSKLEIIEMHWLFKLIAMIIGGLLGAFLVLQRIDIWKRSGLVIASIGILLAIGHLVFVKTLVLLPMLSASLSLLGASALMSGLVWQRDRSQKHFIRQAWSRYVSENVVDSLISNPDTLKLGGERITASFIFTDIEGFTKLSEGLEPEKLSDIINQYLDLMTEEFRKGGATIDKIVGDAIVGFIGAPLEEKDHANKAVALALRLNHVSREFQASVKAKGIDIGKTRIGVNTGPAVIGNFGGSSFFDYTALGDAVNIAARLEGANKKLGSSICVSGETAKCANEHRFRPVGNLYVEGKVNAVEAWEPQIDEDIHLSDQAEYELAYEQLEKGLKGALGKFRSLAKKFPSDHLVKFHLERLENKQTGTGIEIGK